jgi:hypothetical protein
MAAKFSKTFKFNKGNIMKKRMTVTHEAMFQHMANIIATQKRVTLAITGTKKEPGFCYTIGNQEKQLPELLVIGNFKPGHMCDLLNILSEKMIENASAYKDGELVDLGGEYPMLIHTASKEAHNKYTFQAGQFYNNEDYKVMQVVLPDKKGIYPPDPRCHKDYQVPVLREVKGGSKEADSPGADQEIKGQG